MRYTVGVADMKIATERDDILVTHALGSCLGIAIHDAAAGIGGLLHVMLPSSSIVADREVDNVCRFVDTGVPYLFRECYKAGARKERLVVKVAGGASAITGERDDMFQIGPRNFVMLRRLLWKNGVLLDAHEVGGTVSRTMSLEIGSGEVSLRVNGAIRRL